MSVGVVETKAHDLIERHLWEAVYYSLGYGSAMLWFWLWGVWWALIVGGAYALLNVGVRGVYLAGRKST